MGIQIKMGGQKKVFTTAWCLAKIEDATLLCSLKVQYIPTNEITHEGTKPTFWGA